MEGKNKEIIIREFMTDELMIAQANEFAIDDELTLDSLDQTELRVFIASKFGVDTDINKVPAESIRTIKGIIELIQ